MSRTVKGSKGGGFEYWSRRPTLLQWNPHSNKEAKRLTAKAERRQAKEIIDEELKELDNEG